MKRYVQPLKTWIEIVVYVDPSLPQDIAAVNLNHPHSKFKLTDSELQVYSDFVESMISPIQAHEFKITESYQSKKSYAYYVKFYPVDKEGKILDQVNVIFRLAEHRSKTIDHSSNSSSNKSRRFIKSFVINDLVYTDPLAFQNRVDYLCDRLQEGDYSELVMVSEEFF